VEVVAVVDAAWALVVGGALDEVAVFVESELFAADRDEARPDSPAQAARSVRIGVAPVP